MFLYMFETVINIDSSETFFVPRISIYMLYAGAGQLSWKNIMPNGCRQHGAGGTLMHYMGQLHLVPYPQEAWFTRHLPSEFCTDIPQSLPFFTNTM